MSKQYEEINSGWGATLEEAVNLLLKYRREGKLVKVEFNGVTLYSDTVTMDEAYRKVTGKTKVEIDKQKQDHLKKLQRLEREHRENIPKLTEYWMKQGREILTEDKWEYWDEIVPIRLNDLYKGMELGNCLDIIEILNDGGTLDEARDKIYNQGHSGTSFGLVCVMVKEFCDRGKEFAKYAQTY